MTSLSIRKSVPSIENESSCNPTEITRQMVVAVKDDRMENPV